MITNLSPEQVQQLAQHGGRPMRVVDPGTQKVYVIIASELYEKVRPLFDEDEFDIRETYVAQDAALAKVWNEPELDLYNDYDAHKPQ